MIRINLIAPEKPTQKQKRAPSAPGAFQFYLFLILFGGGAAGLCAAGFLMKTTEINKLDNDIAAAQKRQRDLQQIKIQVDALEAKRKTFQTKVDLIERLRREQSDPVHLLDEISKGLPDLVWLTSLEQAGPSVKITGQSNSYTAVADFMSALQRSGWFPSVELSKAGGKEASKETAGELIDFSLAATFKNPETAAKEAQASQAQPAAAPPGRQPAPRQG